MTTFILSMYLMQSIKKPAYPYPPANPCSNPVKCERFKPIVRERWGRGPRK